MPAAYWSAVVSARNAGMETALAILRACSRLTELAFILAFMEMTVTDDRKALLVRITGRVQGVGFRFWTRVQAQRLGLSGWVRNQDDGSVKALITGPDPAISAMLKLLRNGPPGALVSGIETAPTSPREVSRGVRITK